MSLTSFGLNHSHVPSAQFLLANLCGAPVPYLYSSGAKGKQTLSSWLTPALTRSLTERVGGCLSLPAVVEECWCGWWNIGHMETGYSAYSALEPNHQHQPFSGTPTAGIWRFPGVRCWALTFLFPHFSLGWFIVIVSCLYHI